MTSKGKPQDENPPGKTCSGNVAPASTPAAVVELVERFRRNLDAYRNPSYKEAHVRREFIDPLFEALGWDVANREGHAEPYKDVVHEDAVKIGGATKAPDYCFRVGGRRMFFVEAKKPSVDIEGAAPAAYQLRRYAWSADLPLSILTDFEEFAVYDCRVRPRPTDKSSVARVMTFTFENYVSQWSEIAAIFSKDAVLKGSFDRYAQSAGKRGTATVDEAFLAEIEAWRDELARHLALRNHLGVEDLNAGVQLIIDRIIFLRMCEDRGIEPYGTLLALVNGPDIYKRLVMIFERADDKYNSGLFHFRREAHRPAPDELTPDLAVDDTVLAPILRSLYYPDSPYEFSVLGADILGQVYEQFLGKVIRLTEGGRAKVEEKQEVKKAGGVYYTPAHIVRYIVENTAGPLLEGKTPAALRRAPVRILDPACGSGSFLIGAFQYLLDWHQKWYEANNPAEFPKAVRSGPGGQWRLTIQEKKRILLDHIFGVDIDGQAVEVTKLSLLLKVLEGESHDSMERQMRLFHAERALPDLDGNINCGNSLIAPDALNGRQLDFFELEDRPQHVNAFDWQRGFPQVLGPDVPARRRGFDAVIGNPPYVRIQTLQETAPLEVEQYKRLYRSAAKGNYDLYVVFIERGLSLLHKSGLLGFIVPHKFLNAQYGQPLRRLIAEKGYLSHLVHFGDQQVFAGATTYTCLLFLDKKGAEGCRFLKVSDRESWRADRKADHGFIPAQQIGESPWNFAVGDGLRLFAKLTRMPVKLGHVAERIAQGIRTSANEVYVLDRISATRNLVRARSQQAAGTVVLEREAVAPFLQGREIKRFHVGPSGKIVLVPYRVERQKAVLIPEEVLCKELPRTWQYLNDNKRHLQGREGGRMRGSAWYGYVYPKNLEVMKSPKILVPDIADRASFALDSAGRYAFTSGYGITLRKDVKESAEYFLGLLNSKLLDFYLKRVSTTIRGGFFRYFTQYLEQLPIRRIDFLSRTDRQRHDRLAQLVLRMQKLQERMVSLKHPTTRQPIQRLIDHTDRKIDELVYELYGLTKDEIRIAEGADKE